MFKTKIMKNFYSILALLFFSISINAQSYTYGIVNTDNYNSCPVINDIEVFKSKSEIVVANRLSDSLLDIRDKVYTRDVFGGDV